MKRLANLKTLSSESSGTTRWPGMRNGTGKGKKNSNNNGDNTQRSTGECEPLVSTYDTSNDGDSFFYFLFFIFFFRIKKAESGGTSEQHSIACIFGK